MSLPPAAPQRQLKQRRQIDVQVFSRGNGLWEVDAVLTDLKMHSANMVDGPRPAGLNSLQDFRKRLRERLGGVLACRRITELASVLPTAVVQAFAGDVIDTRGTERNASQPIQIDPCYALNSVGDAVRLHPPGWYRAPVAANSGD